MHSSIISALAIALVVAGCSDGTKEESPGEVLARDSSLASELRQADTSAFAEAADVAMAFDPDSAMPPVEAATPAPASPTPASPAPATPSSAPASASAPTSTPAVSGATMRVERPATATPTTSPRAPMRPVPATIHPDPVPTRRLPAAPAPRTATSSRTSTAGSAPAAAPVSSREAVSILSTVPGASLPPAGSDEPCASPTAANQRRCLMLHLARSDVGLDRTYQALITDMKREAGTAPGAREPESVRQLRVAQRAWLVYRDTECRRRNRGKEGPLWAPVRAQCLAEFSGTRTEELAQALRDRRGR
jgi:uncharacterized protein YecT (DUF1311 family)